MEEENHQWGVPSVMAGTAHFQRLYSSKYLDW